MKSQNDLQAGELAEHHFENGLLCAESALMALSHTQGAESQYLPKIATAFCSGMARTCGTCGALTGAMMGISLHLGRTDTSQSVQSTYDATQELISQFEAEFGAKDCHKLLGCDIGTEQGMAHFKQQKLITNCKQYTRRATEIAASIITNSDSRA